MVVGGIKNIKDSQLGSIHWSSAESLGFCCAYLWNGRILPAVKCSVGGQLVASTISSIVSSWGFLGEGAHLFGLSCRYKGLKEASLWQPCRRAGELVLWTCWPSAQSLNHVNLHQSVHMVAGVERQVLPCSPMVDLALETWLWQPAIPGEFPGLWATIERMICSSSQQGNFYLCRRSLSPSPLKMVVFNRTCWYKHCRVTWAPCKYIEFVLHGHWV